MSQTNLVTRTNNEAFTTSLIIANSCPTERNNKTTGIREAHKRTNKSVVDLIEKYKTEFESLGRIDFESLSNPGKDTRIAHLNEDQATFLFTLFTNTKRVVAFKLRLVKEFRKALNEINRLYHEPERTLAIKNKRQTHNPMMDALKELREDQGKEMRDDIYWTENKLCNFIVVGRFIGVCKIGGEDGLTNYEVDLLAQVRKRNEAYILTGLDYKQRKIKLVDFGGKYREKYPDPQPRTPLLELVV